MAFSLEHLTTQYLFHFLLIFSRLGSAFMALPGFGEIYVSSRSRLILAVMISLVMLPLLEKDFPAVPGSVMALFFMLLPEIIIGVFIGAIARALQAILHMGGMILAFQSSLASALLFDANQGSQGSVIGNLLTLIGVTLLFTTGLHHMMILGIAESYTVFPAATFPPIGDMAEMISVNLSQGFLVAFKISAPLIIVGLCLYLGLGLMARLMPNMQVFFIIIPVQIYISFIVLSIVLAAGMHLYLEHFEYMMGTVFGQ